MLSSIEHLYFLTARTAPSKWSSYIKLLWDFWDLKCAKCASACKLALWKVLSYDANPKLYQYCWGFLKLFLENKSIWVHLHTFKVTVEDRWFKTMVSLFPESICSACSFTAVWRRERNISQGSEIQGFAITLCKIQGKSVSWSSIRTDPNLTCNSRDNWP